MSILPIPWTPLSKPLNQCRFGLVTSGGLYHKDQAPPFDLEREIREPAWGDPSYRTLPVTIAQDEVGDHERHLRLDRDLELQGVVALDKIRDESSGLENLET